MTMQTRFPRALALRLASALAVAAVVSAAGAGCAGGGAAAPNDGPSSGSADPSQPVGEILSDKTTAKVLAAEDDATFARTLLAVDRRVDAFIALGVEPGDAARKDRELTQSGLEAVVAQHLDRFLAVAASKDDPTRRRVAVKALAFANDVRAAAAVVPAIEQTSDTHLQTVAGFALARLRDANTPLPPLLAAARSPDVDVRVNALLALWHVLEARGKVGNFVDRASRDAALPVLESVLFDPDDPMVRGHAAAALGALGDPRGVDSLLNLLRDKQPFVRSHTAIALGKLGDRRAIQPLVDVIDETPRGDTKGYVLLAVTLLLEREGISVPAGLADDQRSWSLFVQRAFADKARRPLK